MTSEANELQLSVADKQQKYLDLVADIRPGLHRFCTRMSGSVLDGEDIVQDVLAQSFFKLSSLEDMSRLKPWLFQIAHNKSIDFLRHQKSQPNFVDELTDNEMPYDADIEKGLRVSDALSALVIHLPPMERACLVLKDIMDYPLGDIAQIVETTVGAVKSALHRARKKLAALKPDIIVRPTISAQKELIESYLDKFNRRDWDGVLDLVRSDAQLEVVGFVKDNAHTVMKTGYFKNYGKRPWPWIYKLVVVENEFLPVLFKEIDGKWRAHSALKLTWQDGQIIDICDYIHVDYLLDNADVTFS